MIIGLYVINLDRAPERWLAISAHAEAMELNLIRVPAFDGTAAHPEEYLELNWRAFRRHGARHLLPGEYGCYISHLTCLERLANSDFDAAIIMEDDVVPRRDLIDRAQEILEQVGRRGIVKLYNHRAQGFIRTATTSYGDIVGRCLHGPQGSAACYLVARADAARLTNSLRPICFPYDVALERGWSHRVPVYSLRRNIVTLGPASRSSQIASRSQYRASKVGGFARLVTHLDRAVEYLRRVINTLWMGRQVHENGPSP